MTNIRPKSKQIVFYILMFFFTFSFCFLLLEFVFGQFYYSNLTSISDKVFDHTIGWRLRHGTYWIKPSHTLKKHSIYINSNGIRNRELTISKEKNIKRVLVLGDSFTHATAIPEENIFSTLLEEIINQQIFNKKYEIINCGVSGYGTAQEFLMMKRLSNNGIKGDVYLLMIFTNDILDNLRLSYGSLRENLVQPGFVLHNDGKLELKYLPKKKFQPILKILYL